MPIKPSTHRMERSDFERIWRTAGESASPSTISVAYRRYTSLKDHSPNYNDPSAAELKASFAPLLESVASAIHSTAYLSLPASRPPWTPTSIHLTPGQACTVFATGRIHRSKLLDLWLGPQFGLWCRLSPTGHVFNSTGNSNTFTAKRAGELYLGTQFPGQFGSRDGRVQGPLSAYEGMEGGFEVVVVSWTGESEHLQAFGKMLEGPDGEARRLVLAEMARQMGRSEARRPEGWGLLWFLGNSKVFTEEVVEGEGGGKCICARPYGTVGILQKEVVVALERGAVLEWEWLVKSLPSRLPENETISHDYLSVAVEFENGIDLTYTWSWELKVGFGYWCPLPTWCDREYHVVVRSGEDGLGKWINESRNVYQEYEKYIGGVIPQQIVKVWLIAGNRWQRLEGDMTVKNMGLSVSGGQKLEII